jgi:predicted enzyme related to lactoylglutathione lyase
MPEVAIHAPGKPSWVDLSTTDIEAAKRFYSELFGWEPAMSDDPNAGGYGLFRLRGKDVAGIGPTHDQPMSAWMVYIASDDAAATAEKVKAAGGTVVMEPFDVLEAGRMGVFQDPSGAFISIWEPKAMAGAGITGEPGSLAWAELNARGFDKVVPFYEKVFGWGAKTSPMGEGMPAYTEWQLGGESIAGGQEMNPQAPAEVPSYWMVYFGVRDVDASYAKAKQLGAHEMLPPMDFPGGRFAILADPQGAAFGLLRMTT